MQKDKSKDKSEYKARLPLKLINPWGAFIAWKPKLLKCGIKVDKEGFEKLKPPFVLLINHSCVENYKIASTLMLPNALTYLIPNTDYALNGDVANVMGMIPKKCCYPDMKVVQNVFELVDKGAVFALFPEELPSVDGRTGFITPAVAKLVKELGLPVAYMKIDGAYLFKPFYADTHRKCTIKVKLGNLFTAEEAKELPVTKIYASIVETMRYDDYQYQRDNKIVVETRTLLNGAENILFRCPLCKAEYSITAQGNKLCCANCNNIWTMGRHGVIISESKGSMLNIPIWNEYQKKVLEVQMKEGTYSVTGTCSVSVLDGHRFVSVGTATFKHTRTALMIAGNLNGANSIVFRNSQMHGIRVSPEGWIEVSEADKTYRIAFEIKQTAAKIALASAVINGLYTEARMKRQLESNKRFDFRYNRKKNPDL
ncbi:MAG: hypothetical protein PHX51_05955 [Clostridia bacterium]|nr:hypothetical protein [Clostridia bacterium]